MKSAQPTSRLGALVSIFATGAIGFGCGPPDCVVSAAGCGGTASYVVILDAAPQNLGALMISLETETSATVTILSGRSMPVALDGQGTRPAILIGASPLATIARISFSAKPSRPPSIVLLEAAANQSGGYRPIALSNIRFRIEEVAGSP